jgi:hypothetical protein
MGILRLVLAPVDTGERFEDGRLFSEKAMMARSMLTATDRTQVHRRLVAAQADE